MLVFSAGGLIEADAAAARLAGAVLEGAFIAGALFVARPRLAVFMAGAAFIAGLRLAWASSVETRMRIFAAAGFPRLAKLLFAPLRGISSSRPRAGKRTRWAKNGHSQEGAVATHGRGPKIFRTS